jgi:hypothetical protein
VEEAYQLALRLEQQSWGSQIRRNVQYQGGGNPRGNHVGGSNRVPPNGVDRFPPKTAPQASRGGADREDRKGKAVVNCRYDK